MDNLERVAATAICNGAGVGPGAIVYVTGIATGVVFQMGACCVSSSDELLQSFRRNTTSQSTNQLCLTQIVLQ